jgi:hypothetical protein
MNDMASIRKMRPWAEAMDNFGAAGAGRAAAEMVVSSASGGRDFLFGGNS